MLPLLRFDYSEVLLSYLRLLWFSDIVIGTVHYCTRVDRLITKEIASVPCAGEKPTHLEVKRWYLERPAKKDVVTEYVAAKAEHVELKSSCCDDWSPTPHKSRISGVCPCVCKYDFLACQ